MAVSGVPRTQPLFDSVKRLIHSRWDQWLQSLVLAINNAAQLVGKASIDGATADTVETPFAQSLSAGLYRVSYSLRVVTPASLSSALTASIAWTANGVAQSLSGAALTGNATTTEQNTVWTIAVDANTDVTYAVAYTSVGTPLSYSFTASLEVLP